MASAKPQRSAGHPAQEALWYGIYAVVLRVIVINVVSLRRRLTTPIEARPAVHPAAAPRSELARAGHDPYWLAAGSWPKFRADRWLRAGVQADCRLCRGALPAH